VCILSLFPTSALQNSGRTTGAMGPVASVGAYLQMGDAPNQVSAGLTAVHAKDGTTLHLGDHVRVTGTKMAGACVVEHIDLIEAR
jgi:hypothetical protein